MEKVRIEIDLMKLKNAAIENGKIIIPVEENAIALRTNKDGNMFSIFKMNAYQRKQVGKYNETHIVKRSLTDDERNQLAMGNEIDLPILGNIRVFNNENSEK